MLNLSGCIVKYSFCYSDQTNLEVNSMWSNFDEIPNTWMARIPERDFLSSNTSTETKRTPGKYQQNRTETIEIGSNVTLNLSSEFNE